MNWLNKLEKKLGRFAVPNLIVYLLGGYVIGYILYYIRPELLYWLTLEPAFILRGQIWRIITWVLVPPGGSLLTVLIMLLFYYQIGMTLEHTWGTFRFNVYIISGILFTVIGSFIAYFIYGPNLIGYGAYFTTYYINMSLFLAVAASYPNMEVLLYFVIPIKMKWMGYVYGAMALYTMITGNAITRISVIASLMNFILFFFSGKNYRPYTPGEMARKRKFKQQAKPKMTYTNGATHRCAVCGRTDIEHPELEFRFCSKCNGNFEYCQDHLFTHEHIK